MPIARDFDTGGDLEDFYAFDAPGFAEDRAIVERRHPEDLPLDPAAEAHFAADRTSAGIGACCAAWARDPK